MADAIDFQPYLKVLLPDPANEDWGDRYTPTQVELPLKVQAIVEKHSDDLIALRQPRVQKPERFEVLAGLRQTVREHHQVLLLGKPGSGKSTALRRLLWEDAHTALEIVSSGQDTFTIPVLVELRDCRSGSVLEWLQKALRRLRLSQEAIEDLLFAGRLLLLFDGLNELPSADAYLALDEFRRDKDFHAVPVIVTTRELGAGANLGIEKKLAMLPLTEPQMREFIQKRLPGQADNLLRQLKDRLRELAETPLLLQMLCDVVAESPDGQPPQNRGELFRQEFARRYEKFKPLRGRVSEDSRRFAPELLQHLAFVMTQGEPHTDRLKPTPSWLTIPKAQAETILETYLTNRVEAPAQAAKEWLEDLLEFHLLQFASNPAQIEFHHQLFQEYYAAEKLLRLLPNLSDTRLKQNYLNYLKWTEVIALMLSLIDDETQAVRVVKLALDTDLMLGAMLAGEVKPTLQAQTVELVHQQNVPQHLKVRLLGITHSERAVSALIHALNDEFYGVRESAAEALGRIGSATAVTVNIDTLNDEDSSVRKSAAEALGRIGSATAVDALIHALNDEDAGVYWSAAEALGRIGSATAVDALIHALNHEDGLLRNFVADTLGTIGSASAVTALIHTLNHGDPVDRGWAAEALGTNGSAEAITALIHALNHENINVWVGQLAVRALGKSGSAEAVTALTSVLNNGFFLLRSDAAEALGIIGGAAAVTVLIHALNDADSGVRSDAAEALGNIGGASAETALIRALNYEDSNVCWMAAVALGNIGNAAVVTALIRALNDANCSVRWRAIEVLGKSDSAAAVTALIHTLNHENDLDWMRAAEALGKSGNAAAVTALIHTLNDADFFVRDEVIKALVNIGNAAAATALIHALSDEDPNVRWKAAEALGNIGSVAAVTALVYALSDTEAYVRDEVIKALGNIGNAAAITALIHALSDEDPNVCWKAAEALSKVGGSELLSDLWQLQLSTINPYFPSAIEAIQARCGFYNYEIAQSAVEEGRGLSGVGCWEQKGNAYSINAEVVQIIEQNLGTVLVNSHPEQNRETSKPRGQ